MSRIVELAAHIRRRTADIDAYLQKEHLPSPNFDEDGPSELNLSSGDLAKARDDVLGATLELHQLILGPSLCLRQMDNAVSLQAIYKYNIASKMPIHGEISFAELAERTTLSEVNLRRMLRHAMVTYRTFPALEEFNSEEPNKTGWNHYLQTYKPAYEYYAANPNKAARFAAAMTALSDGHGNSTVVDVGGSTGNVAVLIASQYPESELRFIVQGRPEAFAGVAETLPVNIRERVEFQAHDFFAQQTVVADAYIFRIIFHNWSDARCVEIFESAGPRVALWQMDMFMLTLFNSRERGRVDWTELLGKANSRFSDVRIWTPEGAAMSIIEIVWPDAETKVETQLFP
ncbi:S-adenosyl-L-methionine-dependent methyltransferase [Aspergillus spectabilis]